MMFKCRYDTKLYGDILLNDKNIEFLYFNNDIENGMNNVYVNDGIYFGNKCNMKLLSKAYLEFDKYWSNGTLWGNEILLGEYIKTNNIKYEKIDFGKIEWIRK